MSPPADTSSTDIQRLSPDEQMAGFAKSPFMPRLFIALLLHVLVIGGTSIGYFMRLANPPPPKVDTPAPAKAGDAKPADAKPADAKASDAKPGDAKPSDAKPGDAKPADAKPADATTDPRATNKEYIEKLNEAAKPGELPKQPEKDLLDDLDKLK